MLWLFWQNLLQAPLISRSAFFMLLAAAIFACSWFRFIRLGNLRRSLEADHAPAPSRKRMSLIIMNVVLIAAIVIVFYAAAFEG
jgi:hypothetical protein